MDNTFFEEAKCQFHVMVEYIAERHILRVRDEGEGEDGYVHGYHSNPHSHPQPLTPPILTLTHPPSPITPPSPLPIRSFFICSSEAGLLCS